MQYKWLLARLWFKAAVLAAVLVCCPCYRYSANYHLLNSKYLYNIVGRQSRFHYVRKYPLRQSHDSHTYTNTLQGLETQGLNLLRASLDNLYNSTGGNSSELLMSLVRIGDYNFKAKYADIMFKNSKDLNGSCDEIPSSRNLLSEGYEKVLGCVSNVWIRTSVDSDVGDKPVHESKIIIDGFADSLVSRGLLTLLSEALTMQLSVTEASNMNVSGVMSHAALQVLPTGRTHGFSNMLTLVVSQSQKLLRNQSLVRPDNNENILKRIPNLPMMSGPEVAVLLSGGVDSSVALHLLNKQGACPWEEDMKYAEAVVRQEGVSLECIGLQESYRKEVVEYTIREARNGRTPNPDIMCNSRIKFGMFYDYIGRDFDYIASGHYACIDHQTRGSRLLMSADTLKDQTYFLCNLRQDQVAKALFPIGHMTKQQVRELAKQQRLPTEARKDSQGICFLGKVKFDSFISHYLGKNPGEIRDYLTGELMGTHEGLWFHTIGQRRGLVESLLHNIAFKGPFFVVKKDVPANVLYITNRLEEIDGPTKKFSVLEPNWILDPPFLDDAQSHVRLQMKLRHGPKIRWVTLERSIDEASKKHEYVVHLEHKEIGIASGQFVTFYDGRVCLGGAVIA